MQKTAVKIALVGAGSAQFASHVVTDMCLTEGLRGSNVVLMDINEERLAFITDVAQRLSDEMKAGLKIEKTTSLDEALRGADFVINSVQVGGYSWVEEQRTMAERHGYYRGANLHEFGQMQYFLELVQKMEELCPKAWHIQAGNPVFEGGTYIARNSKIRTIGLCHGFSGYLQVADVLGLDRRDITANVYGFNHWLWLKDFWYKGEDAYPLIDEWIKTRAEEYWARDDRPYHHNQMSKAAIHQYQLFGLVPIGDTPRHGGWWYHNDLATNQHWYGRLGGFDSEIGWKQHLDNCANILKGIQDASADKATPITEALGAQMSGEQIVPIINAIVNNVEGVYQVNIPNVDKVLPDFPSDLVVESKAVVNSSGVKMLPMEPLPRRLVVDAMIPRWHYAELKLEVMRSREKEALLVYLLRDHRTRDLAMAEGLMNEWLAHPRTQYLGIH